MMPSVCKILWVDKNKTTCYNNLINSEEKPLCLTVQHDLQCFSALSLQIRLYCVAVKYEAYIFITVTLMRCRDFLF